MTRTEAEPLKSGVENTHGDGQAANLEARLAPYVMHKLAELRWGPNTLPGFIPETKDIGLNTAALVFGPIVCSAAGKERARTGVKRLISLSLRLSQHRFNSFSNGRPSKEQKMPAMRWLGTQPVRPWASWAELNPYVLGATVVVGGAALIGGAYSKRAEIADVFKQVSTKTTDDLALVKNARHLREQLGPDVYGSLPMLIPGAGGFKLAKAMTPGLKTELPALAKTAYEHTLSQLHKLGAMMPKLEPPMQLVPEVAQTASQVLPANAAIPAIKDYYFKMSAHLENHVPEKGTELIAPFDLERGCKSDYR